MRPNLSTKNLADSCLIDSVQFRYLALTHSIELTSFFFRTNFKNQSVGENAMRTALTMRVTPLEFHVQIVVQNTSQPKMFRVCARWIIAIMKHVHAFWNWAIMKNPACPWSLHWTCPPSGLAYTSIPLFIEKTIPPPAPASAYYHLPESLWKRIVKTLGCEKFRSNFLPLECFCEKFDLHNQLVWLCHALGPTRREGTFILRS